MAGSRTDGLWWTTALMSCAILIAGCDTSTDAPKKSAARPSGASVSATSSHEQSLSATTSPSPNTPSTPVATVPVLADGRYAARLIAVDSNRRLVTVDVGTASSPGSPSGTCPERSPHLQLSNARLAGACLVVRRVDGWALGVVQRTVHDRSVRPVSGTQVDRVLTGNLDSG